MTTRLLCIYFWAVALATAQNSFIYRNHIYYEGVRPPVNSGSILVKVDANADGLYVGVNNTPSDYTKFMYQLAPQLGGEFSPVAPLVSSQDRIFYSSLWANEGGVNLFSGSLRTGIVTSWHMPKGSNNLVKILDAGQSITLTPAVGNPFSAKVETVYPTTTSPDGVTFVPLQYVMADNTHQSRLFTQETDGTLKEVAGAWDDKPFMMFWPGIWATNTEVYYLATLGGNGNPTQRLVMYDRAHKSLSVPIAQVTPDGQTAVNINPVLDQLGTLWVNVYLTNGGPTRLALYRYNPREGGFAKLVQTGDSVGEFGTLGVLDVAVKANPNQVLVPYGDKVGVVTALAHVYYTGNSSVLTPMLRNGDILPNGWTVDQVRPTFVVNGSIPSGATDSIGCYDGNCPIILFDRSGAASHTVVLRDPILTDFKVSGNGATALGGKTAASDIATLAGFNLSLQGHTTKFYRDETEVPPIPGSLGKNTALFLASQFVGARTIRIEIDGVVKRTLNLPQSGLPEPVKAPVVTSVKGALAPGGIITLTGNYCSQIAQTDTPTFPENVSQPNFWDTKLAGMSVELNGTPIPLGSASTGLATDHPCKITAQVPFGAMIGAGQLVIKGLGSDGFIYSVSAPFTVAIAESAPIIPTLDPLTRQISVPTGEVGKIMTFNGTGFGPPSQAIPDGTVALDDKNVLANQYKVWFKTDKLEPTETDPFDYEQAEVLPMYESLDKVGMSVLKVRVPCKLDPNRSWKLVIFDDFGRPAPDVPVLILPASPEVVVE